MKAVIKLSRTSYSKLLLAFKEDVIKFTIESCNKLTIFCVPAVLVLNK